MAAVFETISTVYQNFGVGVSVTVPAPAGLVVGELMVVQGVTNADVGTSGPVNFPAGWTILDQTNVPVGNPIGFMGFKVAVLADLGASFIFSHNGAVFNEWNVGIWRISAHTGTDTFSVIASDTIPPFNPALPSVITIADNVQIFRFAGWETTGIEPTFTGPVAGHTTRAQNGGPFDPGAGDTSGIWVTRNAIVTPPGNVGANVVPQDGTGNTRAIGYTLGIAPFTGIIVAVNQAQETDLAQPIMVMLGGAMMIPVLQAAETNVAQALQPAKGVPVLQATEVNEARPMFTLDFFPFLTLTEADERCEQQVVDGTWVVCHSQRLLDGTIGVRFQRFMSPLNPDFGKWEDVIDKTVN